MNGRQKLLYDKFNSAIKSGNYNAVISILVAETRNLLKTKKQDLIDAIRSSGGSLSDDISDADLAKMISAGLVNNYQPFIDILVRMIFEEGAYSNASGSGAGAKAGGIVMDAVQDPTGALATGISKGIGALGGVISNKLYGKGTKEAKAEIEKQLKRKKALEIANALIQKKEDAKTQAKIIASESELEESKKKHSKKIKIIVGGGIASCLVILAAYVLSKRNN
jgi:outer membrane lipoprotein SlyB